MVIQSNENLPVCDVSGEQVLRKSATHPTTDVLFRGLIIASGYAVYVQRINAFGEKQFTDDGLLVTETRNQVHSWIGIWSLTIAIIQLWCLLIHATAEVSIHLHTKFLRKEIFWENGISLSTSPSTYQANPKVVQTSDGNFVVTWVFGSSPNKIAMQNFLRLEKNYGEQTLFSSQNYKRKLYISVACFIR